MDITDIVTEDYESHPPDTPVSKLVGTFDDQTVSGVVVQGADFEGVVTRRQLVTSHHQPNEKLSSIVWQVPRVTPNEDIRRVAELMIDSDARLLPVFDGDELLGVVTVDDVLRAVKTHLDAATVAQAQSTELVTLDPESTVGAALHSFREHRITHLPVVENGAAIGMLSLYDLVGLTVRAEDRSSGGEPSGHDSFGGDLSAGSGRAHGGFGAREGGLDRVLDLPVRDLMVSPVRTIHPEETLDTAVEDMFAIGGSSLVVTANGAPFGIVTKTDILDSLTWEASGNRPVQISGVDLMDDIEYDAVVAMIEKFDDRDHGMNVLDAKIHLHEHKETLRGTPLLLARIRLHTDRGLFIASGEGYGASHAINEARDMLERQIRDRKTYGASKKPPTAEFWERRFGWMLEG